MDWAGAQALTDKALEAKQNHPLVPRTSARLEPDYAVLHQELKRPGVT